MCVCVSFMFWLVVDRGVIVDAINVNVNVCVFCFEGALGIVLLLLSRCRVGGLGVAAIEALCSLVVPPREAVNYYERSTRTVVLLVLVLPRGGT